MVSPVVRAEDLTHPLGIHLACHTGKAFLQGMSLGEVTRDTSHRPSTGEGQPHQMYDRVVRQVTHHGLLTETSDPGGCEVAREPAHIFPLWEYPSHQVGHHERRREEVRSVGLPLSRCSLV